MNKNLTGQQGFRALQGGIDNYYEELNNFLSTDFSLTKDEEDRILEDLEDKYY